MVLAWIDRLWAWIDGAARGDRRLLAGLTLIALIAATTLVSGPIAGFVALLVALVAVLWWWPSTAARTQPSPPANVSPAPSAAVALAPAEPQSIPAVPQAAPAIAAVPDGTPALRSLLDAMPDPVIAVDAEFTVVHANNNARHIFPSVRTGAPIALASRAPELADALEHAVKYSERRTVRLHERIPVERRLDATISPLRRAGQVDAREPAAPGAPALVIVLHDVSERERLETMRSDFIAHASHELRTPLAALRGFIETLQGAAKDDPAARERFLGIMSTEAFRMTRLLDDLLSLSRVEMRAHIAPRDTVDVQEILADVVESLAPLAAATGAEVELTTLPQEQSVRGDRDELTQVFVNLLQNAIKYGRKGGSVRIGVSQAIVGGRRRIRIAVADNGPGIAEEHLPRLTERFYRVDDKSSREKGGTGLGLAIVKHILNRHLGELRVESKLGEGSTFYVDLPLEVEI